jgi:hypothetical protein
VKIFLCFILLNSFTWNRFKVKVKNNFHCEIIRQTNLKLTNIKARFYLSTSKHCINLSTSNCYQIHLKLNLLLHLTFSSSEFDWSYYLKSNPLTSSYLTLNPHQTISITALSTVASITWHFTQIPPLEVRVWDLFSRFFKTRFWSFVHLTSSRFFIDVQFGLRLR